MADEQQVHQQTDEQILSRLRRRKNPATAAELGTTASRLSRLDGVERVGVRRKTVRGKAVAGRPAVLFAIAGTTDSTEA